MDRPAQVPEILSTRGLTLHGVSRRSAEIFGRSSEFFIPHKMYHYLKHPSLKPTIFQLLALSHITNYRLPDWLKVFGVNLDAIPRLQLLIPRRHTTLLDPAIYDTEAWIPWFIERPDAGPPSSVTPVGHWLMPGPPRRAHDLLALNKRNFLYARVGENDWQAFPHFAPGSIVRADARSMEKTLSGHKTSSQEPFFLVEHDSGWTCSRLVLLGRDRVLLPCPRRLSVGRELRIGRDGRILGIIDAEIRPVTARPPSRAKPTPPTPLKGYPGFARNVQVNLRELLRRSRARLGLSLREASSISRFIATALSDESYFAAASTLSDYEALPGPPRRIQQIITLCLVYCIGFDDFLGASGLPLDRAGSEPIPDELVARKRIRTRERHREEDQSAVTNPDGFLAALVNQWEEMPVFLGSCLDEISSLRDFSLSDVFWIGGDEEQRHPLLVGAQFAVVNRRSRRPPPIRETVCEESLYLVLERDGRYRCGHCSLEGDNLAVRAYPGDPTGTRRLRNGLDAEVVGQVTTLLRRLV
jgi:hypothetical protein